MKRLVLTIAIAACALGVLPSAHAQEAPAAVRLITLDPGHFHASLVQKFMYAEIDPTVHVYAPAGEDLAEHLKRIESFNTRSAEPTRWHEEIYTGADFLERMLTEKAGNVVVIAGNNARKTDYILKSVSAGLNVLADKPMVITPSEFPKLQEAFDVAQRKGVLLYDIMTERFEITTILQRELSQQAELFGTLTKGTPDQPAITKQSVHYFSKIVAGAPLTRPQWFFDVRQEGEGIVDVTTHLVDLIQWEAFPEQALSPNDVNVLTARRWSTPISLQQFAKVTGASAFPDTLRSAVRNNTLNVFSNGELTYSLRGVHAHVSVEWRFEPPAGASDTHYSVLRGTRANLVIQQGATENYKPALYVERTSTLSNADFERHLRAAIAALQSKYPGIGIRKDADRWAVTIPERFSVGHEAHFAQVTQNYLRYLRAGRLPDWEVPNMLTKYATLMRAYELSHAEGP
jgi:predicted dehydrogenase